MVSEKRPVAPREPNTSSVLMWWKRKRGWRSAGNACQWARTACSSCIGEVHLEELVACLGLGQGLNTGEVAGVAHLVEVEHLGFAFGQQSAHHRAADVHAVERRP